MKLTPILLAFTSIALNAVAGEWKNISDPVTSQVKPGYAGPTAGIVTDRADGTVYLVVNDQGLWRSSDHGASFKRCDGEAIGGRCETGWALQADPAGKRLACFMIYGSSAMTTDGGTTWTKWTTTHMDFGAVDWADTGKRLLGLRHESGGMLTTSADAGATWQDLTKGWAACGVIDHQTFLATKEKEPGIFRTTDTGATWTKVSDLQPSVSVPVVQGNAIYWPTGKSVLVSRDKGVSWESLAAVEATHGPWLSKDTLHFVVAAKTGFSETKDGGKSWEKIAPLPPDYENVRVGLNMTWDATADLLYGSTMTKAAFVWRR